MKACIVNAWAFSVVFMLWREDVLWTFVKNQISGEVCGTSGEHRLTRSFRLSIFPRSVLSKAVLPAGPETINWVSFDLYACRCSSVLTFLWDTETAVAVYKQWWTWFSFIITAWRTEGNSSMLLEIWNLKEYEIVKDNEWKTRVKISLIRSNRFYLPHTFTGCKIPDVTISCS